MAPLSFLGFSCFRCIMYFQQSSGSFPDFDMIETVVDVCGCRCPVQDNETHERTRGRRPAGASTVYRNALWRRSPKFRCVGPLLDAVGDSRPDCVDNSSRNSSRFLSRQRSHAHGIISLYIGMPCRTGRTELCDRGGVTQSPDGKRRYESSH